MTSPASCWLIRDIGQLAAGRVAAAAVNHAMRLFRLHPTQSHGGVVTIYGVSCTNTYHVGSNCGLGRLRHDIQLEILSCESHQRHQRMFSTMGR